MNHPDRYRWVVVAVTILNQAVMTGIALYCFAIFSIPWLEQFEVSRGELVLAISFLQIATSVVAPYIGARLDRMSLLWPVIGGYLLFCTGLLLLSIANAYWQIILVYGSFLAISQTLAGTLVSQILINRWFTTNNGLALGVSATGTSLGGIVFPLLIAEALLTWSLPIVFQSMAVVLFVAFIPVNYLVLRVQPPSIQPDENTSSPGAPPQDVWTTSQILRSAAFWVPLSVLLAVSTSFVAIQANLGVHLNDLSYPATFTGQMIAVVSAMMVVGKVLYGQLADRLDHVYLLLFMGTTSIAAIALLMSTADSALLLTAAGLLGIASGGLLPIMGAVFVSRFGISSFGKVIGLVTFCMAAASLGSLYAAWIYDVFGSYRYAFLSFIALTVPGLLVLRWLPSPHASEPSESREAS